MENEKKMPSRRKIVFGFGVLSVLAAVGITVAPKKTILFAGVVLKLVPVIVTDVPTGPEDGEKELIVG